MSAKKTAAEYGNESISALKGADRVRKRPGVIFGSDDVEGCQHSIFEIISNSVDEARLGFGGRIIVTRYNDFSVEVQDFGRGCPVDYNQSEGRYNWELVFCELYAGGKYDDSYGFSLGLNGLGLCATQYASEYMDVEIIRDGFIYNLHFERGDIVGEMRKEAAASKKTGSRIRWRPDLDVFTDISVPIGYYRDIMHRQAVVNKGITFTLRIEREGGGFDEETFRYENGIIDYTTQIAGEQTITPVQYRETDREGRDREDKDDYKVKLSVAFCFSNRVKLCEYYHNSSFLEIGRAHV